MKIIRKIKSWFTKKKKPIFSKESDETLKATIDHYISWYKGENPPPLDIGKSIWFIQMDDEGLYKKYGPSKAHLNTNPFCKPFLNK